MLHNSTFATFLIVGPQDSKSMKNMDDIKDAQEYYDQIFEQAQIEREKLVRAEFADCKFVKCDFEAAIFDHCRFTHCKFRDCNLSLMQIPESSFPSTIFEKSKLIGVDWTQGNWSQVEFSQLDGFFDCVLSHSTFIGLELKGIQIKNCIANEVDFREADLSKVDFRGTDLTKSLFGNTKLVEADLSRARNYQIDPGNNNLKAAKFSLPEAMALLYCMEIEIIEQDDSVW
jgi:fluoroquinolone resistance protein